MDDFIRPASIDGTVESEFRFVVRRFEGCAPCEQHNLGVCRNRLGDTYHPTCLGCGVLADPYEAWTASDSHGRTRPYAVTVCNTPDCLIEAIENAIDEDDRYGVAAIASRMLAAARRGER